MEIEEYKRVLQKMSRKEMKEFLIERKGTPRGGYWIIVEQLKIKNRFR